MANPHKDWQRFGEIDPYFGVLSSEKFRLEVIDEGRKDEFFLSGVEHARICLSFAEKYFTVNRKGTALDFGCGVGRLVCGFANYFDHVVGLDISPGMLATARRDSLTRTSGNVSFEISTKEGVLSPETYDFAHTYIVLQHIPTSEGEEIIRRIVSSLKPGGVGALHLTYGSPYGPVITKARQLAKENLLSRGISNLARGRKWNFPTVQMNLYDLPKILSILTDSKIANVTLHLIDDWGHRGAFLFFQKPFPGDKESPWSNPVRNKSANQ